MASISAGVLSSIIGLLAWLLLSTLTPATRESFRVRTLFANTRCALGGRVLGSRHAGAQGLLLLAVRRDRGAACVDPARLGALGPRRRVRGHRHRDALPRARPAGGRRADLCAEVGARGARRLLD